MINTKLKKVGNDIKVKDKKTGNDILLVHSYEGITCIDMYDENGKSVYFRSYDKSGNLIFYDDKNVQRHYLIAENINAAV